jgi:hypothetical protein
MTSCVACVPGKYKQVLGTSACIGCPANTEAVAAGTTVCSSVAGFSGLGYALDDVARSCGVGLNETCATLANGATSNAGGAVDGALDANTNTFVSVAFNPNLARSCGITGTAACVASNAPFFQGAASLGNDGDINTATRTQYGIAPFWSVDFGRSTPVFAVNMPLVVLLAEQFGARARRDGAAAAAAVAAAAVTQAPAPPPAVSLLDRVLLGECGAGGCGLSPPQAAAAALLSQRTKMELPQLTIVRSPAMQANSRLSCTAARALRGGRALSTSPSATSTSCPTSSPSAMPKASSRSAAQ